MPVKSRIELVSYDCNKYVGKKYNNQEFLKYFFVLIHVKWQLYFGYP